MKYQYNLNNPSFRVCDIDIQRVSRPLGYKHSFKSGRAKHGFVYTVKGRMQDVFYEDSEELISARGELVFIPKGCVSTGIYLDEETEIKIVQFDVSHGELPEYLEKPTKLTLPNVGELIGAFFTPTESSTAAHPFYYLSCLYKLFWQIDESYSRLPKKYRKLGAALSEIAESFNKNESVAYYAALCDMSEGNFRRLFREYMGVSPIEYRNDLRLASAKNKLQSGEYNVSETAELCGFTNLSFFTRLYKKKYGYTPRNE